MSGTRDTCTVQSRLVLYVAHPVAPTPAQIAEEKLHPTPRAAAVKRNVARAMRWLAWLRRSFPEVTFVAPWIASILSGEDDSDPRQREAGLVDADAVVPRCDGVVLCGGRISSGMGRERGVALRAWDLTPLGDEPPVVVAPGPPWLAWAARRESEAVRSATRESCVIRRSDDESWADRLLKLGGEAAVRAYERRIAAGQEPDEAALRAAIECGCALEPRKP